MLIRKQNVLYNTDSGTPSPIITPSDKISTLSTTHRALYNM